MARRPVSGKRPPGSRGGGGVAAAAGRVFAFAFAAAVCCVLIEEIKYVLYLNLAQRHAQGTLRLRSNATARNTEEV